MKTSKLRIALVGPLPPPAGGMANQTLQLARLLREEGASVELIQVNRPYQPAWIGKVKGARALFRLLPYLLHLWRASRKADLFHVMANSGWSWHLFATPAVWIARLTGVPVVVNYRGGEADAFFEKSFALVKPTLERADAIVVPSGFLENVFGKRAVSTRIVPNIIDLGRFRSEAKHESRQFSHAPCILVARNLEPIYDNATALRAFRIVKNNFPSARLVVTGTGPQKKELEELAHELGLAEAVTFTGHVKNEDMVRLYREADVMVNPSLADNMPISVLESLASGVPVVSTNVGGVPYLVEHDVTALLVPVQNPAVMADAILTLLTDPEKADSLRQVGAASVARYSWPHVRTRLFGVYESVLATGRRLANRPGE